VVPPNISKLFQTFPNIFLGGFICYQWLIAGKIGKNLGAPLLVDAVVDRVQRESAYFQALIASEEARSTTVPTSSPRFLPLLPEKA
jgi:hypothetical protein